MPDISEFFTWNYLATFAGAMVATGIVTEFLKGFVDNWVNLPTRFLACITALVILLLAQFFVGELTLSSGVLSLFNAVLVACATSGTIDAARELRGE